VETVLAFFEGARGDLGEGKSHTGGTSGRRSLTETKPILSPASESRWRTYI
jgi:hypothetical protein